MKTLEHNGEYWYIDERSLWKRCRQWLIWIGGWEKPNGTGWKFRNSYDSRIFMSPTPISLFGHRITFFDTWFQVKPKPFRFILTVSKRSGIYISNDGTRPDPGRNQGFYILKPKGRRVKRNGRQTT